MSGPDVLRELEDANGADAGTPGFPSLGAVRSALAEVPDPEIPIVSVLDLGMVERVEVDDRGIRVQLLPTFLGCPALEAIRDAVSDRLAAFGVPVDVRLGGAVPWTTDRITDDGRTRLHAAGFAPPGPPESIRCPRCDSAEVTIDNLFGPTLCRSLCYCRSCHEPFEWFKEA